eukprot:gene9539-12181_t
MLPSLMSNPTCIHQKSCATPCGGPRSSQPQLPRQTRCAPAVIQSVATSATASWNTSTSHVYAEAVTPPARQPQPWANLANYSDVADLGHLDDLVETASTSGKKALPLLDQIPKEPSLPAKVQFLKADISKSDLSFTVIKSKSIRGLPYICINGPDQELAFGMSANPNNMTPVLASLETIAANPKKQFVRREGGAAKVSTRKSAPKPDLFTKLLFNLSQTQKSRRSKAKATSHLNPRVLLLVLTTTALFICGLGMLNPNGLISGLLRLHVQISTDSSLVRLGSAILSPLATAALLYAGLLTN